MATIDSIPGARAAARRMTFDGETMDLGGGLVGGLDPSDFSIADPRIGGMRGVFGIFIDGASWALPAKSRVSPGRGCLFVLGPDDALHVLLSRRGRIRELLVPADLADRIRSEAFTRA
ncbi:hypothetical protein [Microbacterium sp. Bi128]|uniref:hypothetical protein n=1 Tax=Microbacterium sp. Bi128 TaxID=2821115 RepID=UPI001DBD0A05|nr:hypothetical protein [Microbacterium sp. Bi128]CAH0172548.1 hypothetical protein SRABI128_01069 [Microbacterium sp. Bi128]